MSIGKGRVTGREGGKGWELTLCLRTDIPWNSGNFVSELTLAPVEGLRIFVQPATPQQ
jgi:hypothetical protein